MSYDILQEIEAKAKYHAREHNGSFPNLCLIPFDKFGDFLNQAEKRQGYTFNRGSSKIVWHGLSVHGCEISGETEIIVAYRHCN